MLKSLGPISWICQQRSFFSRNSNKVWPGKQDVHQIHRLRVKRAARNICCSTGAICQSTMQWHLRSHCPYSKQTTTLSLLAAVVPNGQALRRSGRPTPTLSSGHSCVGNPPFCSSSANSFLLQWLLGNWLLDYDSFNFSFVLFCFGRNETGWKFETLDLNRCLFLH